MKKLISFFIIAVMLISLCAVSASAANGPMPTNPEFWGGASIGFSNMDNPENVYVVNDKGEGLVIDNSAVPGAAYDRATNTLTLTDIDAANSSLFIWYMGDDFKLKIVGNCKLGAIYVPDQVGVYNTNLHITGDGSLTVNENRKGEAAIMIYSAVEGCPHTLSIDASVTLHLYGADSGNTIISNYGSSVAKAAEAISVGGKGIDGVRSGRISYEEYEEANLMVVRSRTKQVTDGWAAKSKSDPTGKYAVSWWSDDGNRFVKHYVYADSLGLWVADQSFAEYGGSTRSYTKEEFEQQYTVEQSDQPVKIRFTDDDREANLGYETTQFAKADEPGVVYGGSGSWRSQNPDYSKPEGYNIFRLNWDEAKGVYVEDESAGSVWVAVDELEEQGWSIVTKTETRQKELSAWANPAPYDENNREYYGKVYRSKGISADYGDYIYYLQTGTYTSDGGGDPEKADSGVVLNQLWYDEENDVYYLKGREYQQMVSTRQSHYARLDVLYDPVYEEVTENVKIRYINSYFGFDSYSAEGTLTKKAGEDNAYVTRTYDYDDGVTRYSVQPVELRANGHYYALKWEPDDSGYFVRDYTAEEFAAEGYSFATALQDNPFTVKGHVDFMSVNQYSDANGNLYGVEWSDSVYRYSEDGLSLTFGDTTYYEATPTDKTADELISSAHEVVTDMYQYTLTGNVYHHEGGAAGNSLLGDADNDDKLTILDATAIQRKLANLPTASFNEKAADADEDTKVTILDATAIQRKLASLPTHEGLGEKRV